LTKSNDSIARIGEEQSKRNDKVVKAKLKWSDEEWEAPKGKERFKCQCGTDEWMFQMIVYPRTMGLKCHNDD